MTVDDNKKLAGVGRPQRAQDPAHECGVENIGGEGTEGNMAAEENFIHHNQQVSSVILYV